VVTFGELLLRLAAPGTERLFQSPSLRTWWGGAEANVAAGLASLGTAVAHVSRVPANPPGEAAVRALRAEGVDVGHIARGGERLGLYYFEGGVGNRPLQVTYDRAHSAFATLDPLAYDWASILHGASWFHVSGITPALGEGPRRAAQEALAAARGMGVPTSIDLNFRPALWAGRDPVPVMAPLVEGVDLLIGNPGAIAAMLGVVTAGVAPEPVEAVETTARTLMERFGVQQVIITQRTVLSSAVHGWQVHGLEHKSADFLSSGVHRLQLVDRVGGGDSFVAAFLHTRLTGRPFHEALDFGLAASILKCTIPGDANRVSEAEIDACRVTLRPERST
jgi:2-dehydro-3-deoxygluconokinase